MKIKLERFHGYSEEEGKTQNFFGVQFVCANRPFGEDQVLSEWFADIPAKEAQAMEKVGRVEILGKSEEETKQDKADKTIKEANK